MNVHEIVVDEFNENFVHYRYSTGGEGLAVRDWFPDVEVGQIWKMTCYHFLIVECVKLFDA